VLFVDAILAAAKTRFRPEFQEMFQLMLCIHAVLHLTMKKSVRCNGPQDRNRCRKSTARTPPDLLLNAVLFVRDSIDFRRSTAII